MPSRRLISFCCSALRGLCSRKALIAGPTSLVLPSSPRARVPRKLLKSVTEVSLKPLRIAVLCCGVMLAKAGLTGVERLAANTLAATNCLSGKCMMGRIPLLVVSKNFLIVRSEIFPHTTITLLESGRPWCGKFLSQAAPVGENHPHGLVVGVQLCSGQGWPGRARFNPG